LWNRWFDLARQANPEAFTSMMNNDEAQRVIRSWQEASQQAVNAQMEWMRMFAQQGQAMQEQMTQPTDVNQQHGQGQ
jgi:peptidyl-tRNA hydrolase